MTGRRGATLLLAVFLAACGGLRRPAPDVVWFGLDPPVPSGGLAAEGPTLVLPGFSTSEPFQTARVATLTGPSRWDYSRRHRWVAEPGEMAAHLARRHLQRTGLFAAVLPAPGPFEPDYRLGGAVQSLYWDRQQGEAVVEIEVSLVRNPDAFVGYWVLEGRRPVAGDGADAFVRAASAALGDVLDGLTKKLEQVLARAEDSRGR